MLVSGHSNKSSVEVHYTLDQLSNEQHSEPTQPKQHSPVPSIQPLGPSGLSVLPPAGLSQTPPVLSVTSGDCSRRHASDNFQWPGVDILIEAYHRHVEGLLIYINRYQ